MGKDIVELTESELFTGVPILTRLATEGPAKMEQLVLRQRNFTKDKVLLGLEPADTRLKFNSIGQLEIRFTKKIHKKSLELLKEDTNTRILGIKTNKKSSKRRLI